MKLNHLFLLLFAACLTGCGALSTVHQTYQDDTVASFDGNEQNSGIIGIYADKDDGGYLVSDGFRARYVWMAKKYGKDFDPPISPDYPGLRPEKSPTVVLCVEHQPGKTYVWHARPGKTYWNIDFEGMTYFLDLNSKSENAIRKPK